jgi:hypothetical protein
MNNYRLRCGLYRRQAAALIAAHPRPFGFPTARRKYDGSCPGLVSAPGSIARRRECESLTGLSELRTAQGRWTSSILRKATAPCPRLQIPLINMPITEKIADLRTEE